MPVENDLFIMSNIWRENSNLDILISFIGIYKSPIALFHWFRRESIAFKTSVSVTGCKNLPSILFGFK